MAKIRIVGDSSGYVELAAPNAAGNNTLELPSNATKLVGADASNSLNVTGIATFSSGIVVSAGSTSAPSISPSGDSNTGIFFPSADTVCIGEGGSEALRVNSSGNVGIGTTNISAKLTLSGGEGAVLDLRDGGDIRLYNGTNSGSIQLYCDTNEKLNISGSLEISNSGRFTCPNQPAFLAFFSNNNDTTTNAGAVFAFDKVDFNVGGHFNTSTNRFTCPVAGIYAFSWAFFFTNSASNTQGMNVAFLVNGSQYSPSDGVTTSDALQMSTIPNSAGGYLSNSATYYIQLSANDYVQLYARGANVRLYQGHSHFSGILLA